MSKSSHEVAAMDIGAYCREVEAFLCRRNGGHLIRLVGPAFALVSGWATEGIPVRVALEGIERTIARREVRGTQRRPVRVEFCEADVRDAYAQWRRAVGPHASRASASSIGAPPEHLPGRRQPPLFRHIERVIERLSSVRASRDMPPAAGVSIDTAIASLDQVLAQARGARGDARQALCDALARIDETLMTALAEVHAVPADGLAARARAELRPLRSRLSDAAYRDALARVQRHLLRVALGLPEIVLP